MDGFINSQCGMFMIQVFLHSAVTALLADLALLAWGIVDPAVKQRFRFMALALPLVYFPLLYFIAPHRHDTLFRLNALFDSRHWLSPELFMGVSLLPVLVTVFVLTTLIFVVQEVIPIFAHLWEQRKQSPEDADNDSEAGLIPGLERKLDEALEPLPIGSELVEILDDNDLYLYSSTGLRPMVFVSSGLLDELGVEELRAALAHEAAHLLRNRKPSLVLGYLLRVCMFFNPVAMVIFRKMAQEEEQICDNIAVRLTGNPEALVRAVELFRSHPGDAHREVPGGTTAKATAALEQYSHDLLLQSRITLIRNSPHNVSGTWKMPFVITLIVSVGINYFIV
jgi:Zn-dependent protease with chaperone function